jgi:hypothetical protein
MKGFYKGNPAHLSSNNEGILKANPAHISSSAYGKQRNYKTCEDFFFENCMIIYCIKKIGKLKF